ncbi:CatB-related O-acetyltransferase [Zunongwangia sp. F363]|uniref:CatB-related O-acetyltransferase n=1 Tax=Autumnicola tepida TaxID=3075595 RepID=A0ABU3C7Y6_9FLAO|nr:CatB-related O-acetyltransferase [Zunongwangia sp. F363]MDT0642312.1 CatB-related O-acetyltransferase [Zunongwangia sp. F363]
MLINYLTTLFQKKRYYKAVSFFSFWDKYTSFSKSVYIGFGVRLGNAKIGNYSRVRQLSTIYYTEIGKFSGIGVNSRIGIGQHPLNLLSTNLIFYKKNQIKNSWVRNIDFQEYKPTKIGNDVWVGESVMILGGIKIGDGAVIAARSVVTKDVPPYAIVGGVPAKIIKYRFDQEIIKRLLEIQWWNWSESKIEKNIEIFTKENISLKDLEVFNFKKKIPKAKPFIQKSY